MSKDSTQGLLASILSALENLQPEGTIKIDNGYNVRFFPPKAEEEPGDVKLAKTLTYKYEGKEYSFDDVTQMVMTGEWSVNHGREVMGLPSYFAVNEEEAGPIGPITAGVMAGQKDNPPVNKRAQLLRDAEEIINGARAQTYGPPEISFSRIAAIWNGMGLTIHTETENTGFHRALDATDVALVLIGMKLSRTIGAVDHEDNWLDLAGYAGLGAELAARD